MKKIIKLSLLTILISSLGNTFAIDLQTKSRNSDKSLYESISNYKIMAPGYLQTSFSYSLLSNPLVNDDGQVLVDGLHEFDLSMVYGFNRYFELGLSAPYIQTVVSSEGSNFNEYQGLSDLYLEGKINIFDYFSIIPVYIANLGNGLATTGTSEGGYGLKIVGGTNINKRLVINYTVGQFLMEETTFGDINQEVRNQVGLGLAYNINKNLVWGGELINDTAENRKSTELLTHFTLDVNNFKTRMGVGSGAFNENDENNLRVFFSLITDFNVFGKKEPKKIKPIKFDKIKDSERKEMFFDSTDVKDEIDKVDSIMEEPIERSVDSKKVDKKKLREELEKIKNNKDSVNDKISVEGHSVIPFYSIEEIKKDTSEVIKNNKVNNKILDKSQLDLEDLRYLESRREKIEETQRTLEYFLNLYKNKKITKQRALKEFNWAKRLLKMRRSSIDYVAKLIKEKYGKKLDKNKITVYSEKTKAEKEAEELLNSEKEYFNKIVKDAKNKVVDNKKTPKSLKSKKEVPSEENKKEESESARVKRLRAEQEAVWNDGRTLLEMRRDLRKKIKNKNKLKKPVVKKESIKEKYNRLKKAKVKTKEEKKIVKKAISKKVVKVKKEEKTIKKIVKPISIGVVVDKKVLENDLKTKINSLIKNQPSEDEKTNDYEDFYNTYKKKIEEYKKMKREKVKLEMENKKAAKKKEPKRIPPETKKKEVNKPVKIDNKDAGELEVIELKNYKVKSIEERYEDLIIENSVKDEENKKILDNFLDNSDGAGLQEEGYIEKSSGPDY